MFYRSFVANATMGITLPLVGYQPFVANATMGITLPLVGYQPFVANATMGFADGSFVSTNLLSLTRQGGSRMGRLFLPTFCR